MQLTCKICNCEIDNYNHFYKIHKISYKKYFDKYLKTKENSTCKICGNDCYFDREHHCYCKYCSARCRNLDKDDIITLKKKTAKEIWEQDKLKDEMCNERNIKLLRIAEYDWDNDNENIKTKIYNFLTE